MLFILFGIIFVFGGGFFMGEAIAEYKQGYHFMGIALGVFALIIGFVGVMFFAIASKGGC